MAAFVNFHVRFERNIDKSGDCWVWTGSKNMKGYGQIKVGRRKRGYPVVLVHRWAYQQWVGRLRNDLVVMHTCDNPSCANPDHLRLGTQADNMQDMRSKGRNRKGVGSYAFGARKRKLTDDDVRAIRIDDRPANEVSAHYNISEPHVYAIKARKRKAHVAD
jgi:hypothetical protein